MKGIGVSNVVLDLIIDLHTATSSTTTARVCLAGHLSSPFKTSSEGVRQGCVLANVLCCRAMDFIMNHASPKLGIQVGQHIDYVTLLVDQKSKQEHRSIHHGRKKHRSSGY